jgi:hypothetical protein
MLEKACCFQQMHVMLLGHAGLVRRDQTQSGWDWSQKSIKQVQHSAFDT